MHGQGSCTYANGNEYVGTWEEGRIEGEGKLTFANGDVYVGRFKNSKMCGFGIYRYVDGDCYEGVYFEPATFTYKTTNLNNICRAFLVQRKL